MGRQRTKYLIEVRKERSMTRLIRLALGACAALGVVMALGCESPSLVGMNYPHARTETLGETSEEHYQRVSRLSDQNRRLLNEDLDLLFLTERETRLTRWHTK